MQFSLGQRRMDEIKASVEDGQPFPCHKTTDKRHEAENYYGDWLHVPTHDKLIILNKEQGCRGAAIWREHRRAPLDGE